MGETKQEHILEGVVETVIFQSPDGGFAVFTVLCDVDNREQTWVSTAKATVEVGEDVKLIGEYVVHPTYGQQFRADVIERIMPKTAGGMENYLASGVIKGIGPKRAELIIAEFGIAAFDVIENQPSMLAELKGISKKTAMAISQEFKEKSAQRNTMMYLQNLGLTANQSDKIFKEYGLDAIEKVKKNPYILLEDIFGIGFKIADAIAAKAGIDFWSPFRISAGVMHVLKEGLGDGHVYLPRHDVVGQAAVLLGLEAGAIENQIVKMQIDNAIKVEKINAETDEAAVYLNSYYHAEVYVARKLLELNSALVGGAGDAVKGIAEVQRDSGVTLAKLQKVAVEEALTNGVLVITGGPGTGKTTTINTIIRILEKNGQKIELCAPTGRAAKRMSEATGRPASTMHRLLGINPNSDRFLVKGDLPEERMLKAQCVIVDESSMVDIMLMFRLVKSLNPGTGLILVGDVNQLPSVGAGNVLKDIINSRVIKTVYLDEVFRQSQQSAIIMNAHKINHGEYPALNEKDTDFFFMQENDINKVVDAIAELTSQRLPKFMNVHPMHDIQVLTPQRKSAAGVENLNIILQNALNPSSYDKEEKQMGGFVFREGDKVMQIKNNYGIVWWTRDGDEGTGMFNGDEGIIAEINNTSRKLIVRFDEGKLVEYDFSQLDELVLSYAITIHKSQGSEYDIVVMPIHSGPPMLLNRNLLYTAITRAKRMVVIVGVPATMRRMVDNVRENVRFSSLKYRIERFYRQFFEVKTNE